MAEFTTKMLRAFALKHRETGEYVADSSQGLFWINHDRTAKRFISSSQALQFGRETFGAHGDFVITEITFPITVMGGE